MRSDKILRNLRKLEGIKRYSISISTGALSCTLNSVAFLMLHFECSPSICRLPIVFLILKLICLRIADLSCDFICLLMDGPFRTEKEIAFSFLFFFPLQKLGKILVVGRFVRGRTVLCPTVKVYLFILRMWTLITRNVLHLFFVQSLFVIYNSSNFM